MLFDGLSVDVVAILLWKKCQCSLGRGGVVFATCRRHVPTGQWVGCALPGRVVAGVNGCFVGLMNGG